jgi:hypothetical protein
MKSPRRLPLIGSPRRAAVVRWKAVLVAGAPAEQARPTASHHSSGNRRLVPGYHHLGYRPLALKERSRAAAVVRTAAATRTP